MVRYFNSNRLERQKAGYISEGCAFISEIFNISPRSTCISTDVIANWKGPEAQNFPMCGARMSLRAPIFELQVPKTITSPTNSEHYAR